MGYEKVKHIQNLKMVWLNHRDEKKLKPKNNIKMVGWGLGGIGRLCSLRLERITSSFSCIS